MNSNWTRSVLVAAVATAATVAAATPAQAGDMYFSKSSGRMATVSWLEVGELPPATGVAGNAHFGDMWVEDLGRGRASAFGTVYDVQCEDGVQPYNPGGHGGHGDAPWDEGPGVEPQPEQCVLVSVRWIQGGSLSFSMDKRLQRATLTGTLAVGEGHGTPTAAPPVDITWSGIGEMSTSRQSGTYTSEYGTYSYRYTSSGREAVIGTGSRIGPMIFDDEDGEWSFASLNSYREAQRGRS